jgi:transposase-like protein
MSLYDISDTLFEMYKVKLSETTISELIDDILDEVDKWKNRQLEKAYPIIYIDAIYMSIKEDGKVKKKPVYFIM